MAAGPLARLLAQLVVPVIAVLARDLPAAYAQALQNARKAGGAAAADAAAQAPLFGRKVMSQQEALQILNLTETKTLTPEAVQKVRIGKYMLDDKVEPHVLGSTLFLRHLAYVLSSSFWLFLTMYIVIQSKSNLTNSCKPMMLAKVDRFICNPNFIGRMNYCKNTLVNNARKLEPPDPFHYQVKTTRHNSNQHNPLPTILVHNGQNNIAPNTVVFLDKETNAIATIIFDFS